MAQAPFPPDLIFYDMFSSKTHGEQWTLEIFRRLFDACAGRATELFTYTRSTAARAALLAAGFFVAKGRSGRRQRGNHDCPDACGARHSFSTPL